MMIPRGDIAYRLSTAAMYFMRGRLAGKLHEAERLATESLLQHA
jgi:hypothetical protein